MSVSDSPRSGLALVTGGSNGLGRALCETFSAHGFQLLEFSRSARWPGSLAVDLSRPEAAARVVAECLDGLDPASIGSLVMVINAATVEPLGPVGDQDVSALIAAASVNFVSTIALIAAVTRRFQTLPCRKVIANISSGAALRAHAGMSLYCASKAGVEHFIRCAALEQANQTHPFLFVNVDPGAMDTAMQARLRSAHTRVLPGAAALAQRFERGELASPDVVAQAVLQIVQDPHLVAGARYDVRNVALGSTRKV